MRLVLLGPAGQVGWECQRALQPLGELIVLGRHATEGHCGDLTQPEALTRTLTALQPDWVVNAAAYTAVDKAESEPETAALVNTTAVARVAETCAALGAGLLHYSTDYVFDGAGETPWRETDPVAPLSVYGATKAAGEAAIRASGCRHLILRTSWVYGARGANFARTMLRLAREREALSVVADQWGAPTGAECLADCAAHAIRTLHRSTTDLSGTYHVAARGTTTWHAYAEYVIERARAWGETLRLPTGAIAPIATAQYPTPARRPLNSRLDVRRFESTFDLTLPAWQRGVDRVLAEWLGR